MTEVHTADPIRKQRRPRPVAIMAVLVIAISAAFTAGAGTAGASTYTRLYSTIDGLALRSGPSTGYALLQRVNKNTPLDVTCGVVSQNIGGNLVFLRLTGGQWVSDFYTNSDGWATKLPNGVPYCGGWGASRGVSRAYNAGVPGNCTAWAYQQFQQASGAYPNLSGDARQWATSAWQNGWTVTTRPRVRSIVVFQPGVQGAGGVGHVAWVTAVSGSTITITEMNWIGLGRTDTRNVTDVAGMSYILAP